MSFQKWLIIILIGIGVIVLGGEYLLVRWYPGHKERVDNQTLRLLPYQNDGLGLRMQVAAGLYGKVEVYPGGIRVYRPKLFGGDPSITITSQPNPTGVSHFSTQYMADLETKGTRNQLSGYQFQHVVLSGRDAVMLWQYDSRARSMNVAANILTPDRTVKAVCTTGAGNQGLLTRACDESLRSIQLSGPPSNLPKEVLNE